MSRGCLLLKRKAGESFLIGAAVRVTVVKIQGQHVEIEVEAPMQLKVLRQELVERAPQRQAVRR